MTIADTVYSAAPWDTSVRRCTAFCAVVCSAAAIAIVTAGVMVGTAAAIGVMAVAALVPVGILVLVTRRRICGYRVTESTIQVLRPAGAKTFPLADVRSVTVIPDAMQASTRVFGNGGFFSVWGTFQSEKLGYYEAYVTDHRRTVVLTFPGRTLVLSPEDPGQFARVLLQTASTAKRLPLQ